MVQGKMTAASEICNTCYQTWLTKCPPLKAETWQKETHSHERNRVQINHIIRLLSIHYQFKHLTPWLMVKLTPKRKLWHNLLFTHVIPAARFSLYLSLLKLCDNLSCDLQKILSNLIYTYAYSNTHFTVLLHQRQMPCLRSYSWLIWMFGIECKQ